MKQLRVGAPPLRARRDLLARHQQCAQPFAPFGDCSLVRMANLYANVVQAGTPGDLAACFDLVIAQPARLMNLADYGIAVGNPADLVCWTAPNRRWRLPKCRRS